MWGRAGEAPENVEREADAFRFTRTAESSASGTVVGFELHAKTDSVDPSAVAAHLRETEVKRFYRVDGE